MRATYGFTDQDRLDGVGRVTMWAGKRFSHKPPASGRLDEDASLGCAVRLAVSVAPVQVSKGGEVGRRNNAAFAEQRGERLVWSNALGSSIAKTVFLADVLE